MMSFAFIKKLTCTSAKSAFGPRLCEASAAPRPENSDSNTFGLDVISLEIIVMLLRSKIE
jgi:hypothetical protein